MAGSREPRRGAAIGYLLKAFPVVSETFILNEVRAVEEIGVPLVLLSLKRLEQPVAHGGTAEIRGPLLYAPGPTPGGLARLVRAHLAGPFVPNAYESMEETRA